MFRSLLIGWLVAQSCVCCTDPIENELADDFELVSAFVVNRHGERAPDADELSLSNQKELILNLTYLEGPEGLTNMGKKRSYQMGKFFRQRYGAQHKLVSNLYLRDEIAIRSTDKERTKMTIQVALAAMYPPEPEQQWDEGLGKVWQPIPYKAVPLSEDYLRYYSNCERFVNLMTAAKSDSLNAELAPYMDLIPLIYQKTGQNFTENPLMFETLFDLFRSEIGLGLDIPKWSKPIQHRLGEAARLAYRLYFRNDEMKRIGGGVLLDEFMKLAEDIVAGRPVKQRLRLFSSHDFNLGALMDVANVDHARTIPEYGAIFALELYRSKSTGIYSVLPIYVPQAGSTVAQVMRITGCESSSHCDFSRFKELTEDRRLPEKEFYSICNIKTEL